MGAQAHHPTEPRRLRGLELRSLLLVAYDHCCIWCGGALAAEEPCCCVEHLIPATRGGPRNKLINMAPAHERCNRERGVLPISEWVLLCTRRGRRPNRPAIARALRELVHFAGTNVARAYARRELACMEEDERKEAAA